MYTLIALFLFPKKTNIFVNMKLMMYSRGPCHFPFYWFCLLLGAIKHVFAFVY